jgi:hypothetical protein
MDAAQSHPPVPASLLLEKLYARIPADRFTLGWLTASLERQSFGAMILLLGVLSAAPAVVSMPAQLVLVILAAQMVAGRPIPYFSGWLTKRQLPAPALSTALKAAIPVLRVVEKVFYPRWLMQPLPTKRIVGLAVLLLALRMLLNPLPFSNLIPAAVVVLISLAYLEEDGLMLVLALVGGFLAFGIDVLVFSQIAHFTPA